jgi:hypothetical protein
LGAVREGQFPPIPRLEQGQIGFVVTVKAIVVAAVPSVPHHNVGMFLGDNDVLVGVQAQRRRTALAHFGANG